MGTRLTYPRGPGFLTHNAVAFQMADDWTAPQSPEFFDISTNLDGVVDSRQKNIMGKVTAIPLGFWSAATYALLFAFQPSQRGQLLFPSADLPLVIQTKAGNSITFAAAALSQPPVVTFTTQKALFGPVEWTTLLAGGATGSTAGDYVTIAPSAYVAPSITPANIVTGRYTVTWGATPTGNMANIRTEAGFTVTVRYNWTPVPDDGQIVNYLLDSVTVEVSFTPINLTETDLLSSLMPMDGPGTGAGTSRSGVGGPLTITGAVAGMPSLSIPVAFASESSLRFGKDGRVGQVKLRGMRKATTGTLANLFAFGSV